MNLAEFEEAMAPREEAPPPRPDAAKLRGLRKRLDEQGHAYFPKSGARVRYERRIIVRTSLDAVAVFHDNEIGRAYEFAQRPPARIGPADSPAADAKWGATAPW